MGGRKRWRGNDLYIYCHPRTAEGGTGDLDVIIVISGRAKPAPKSQQSPDRRQYTSYTAHIFRRVGVALASPS